MKLSIIVPAYNEEKTIKNTLDRLIALDLDAWDKEVVVVNDMSTDATAKVLASYSKNKLIRIVNHPRNSGKTGAIKTAQKLVTGDYIIIQDADAEYNPEDIPLLLLAAERNKYTAIYGSRFRGKHEDTIPGHKWGNQMLTQLTNLLYGSELSDMETCYKLIPGDFFRKLNIETNRFSFEPEITAKIIRSGLPILEVPITYDKRSFSEGKKLQWWRDGWLAISTLLKYRFLN